MFVMKTVYFKFIKARWFIAISCLVLGAAIILGIRFFTYHPNDIHYHANFAVYINGQRELFKGSQNYEEDAMCVEGVTVTPITRAHMHDGVNNVVHVEDHAVTWGDFFANLSWNIGSNFIARPDGTIYAENNAAKLNIILNGKDLTDISSVTNKVIRDQDKLLVSYGGEDEAALMQQ